MAVSFEDHAAAEREIKGSGVGFVIVKAARFVEGEKKKVVRVFGERGEGIGWSPSVTRRSVAGFLVERAVEGRGTTVLAN